jgi:hypothetical protein
LFELIDLIFVSSTNVEVSPLKFGVVSIVDSFGISSMISLED